MLLVISPKLVSKMSVESILWGTVGYIAFLAFKLFQPVRSRSGWDFVVQVSFFAAASFAVEECLIRVIRRALPSQANAVATFWHTYFTSIPGSLTLGMLLVAPITGIVMGLVWRLCHSRVSWFAKVLGGRERNFEFPDTFFKMTHDLLGKMTLISTKSGKVYVGVLNEVTSDLDEPARYIRISPVMSGYRRKVDFKVVFDTNYVMEIQEAKDVNELVKKRENLPNRDLLIPMSEVTSLAHFDPELHKRFVEANITLVAGHNFNPDESEEIPPGTLG
jgi:uncharacterized protein (DUF983 family)